MSCSYLAEESWVVRAHAGAQLASSYLVPGENTTITENKKEPVQCLGIPKGP